MSEKRTQPRLPVNLPIRWGEGSARQNAFLLDASPDGLRLSADQALPVGTDIVLEFTAQVHQRGSWYGADPFALSMGGIREQTVLIKGTVCHSQEDVSGGAIMGVLLREDDMSGGLSLLREFLEEAGYEEL